MELSDKVLAGIKNVAGIGGLCLALEFGGCSQNKGEKFLSNMPLISSSINEIYENGEVVGKEKIVITRFFGNVEVYVEKYDEKGDFSGSRKVKFNRDIDGYHPEDIETESYDEDMQLTGRGQGLRGYQKFVRDKK